MRSSKRVSVFLVGGALTIALSTLAPAVYAQGTDGAIGEKQTNESVRPNEPG